MVDYNKLISLIQQSKHCVVLTGAGISTLSGIPDFRGKNGIYKRKDIDANKIFDIDAFRSEPSYYYTHARHFIYNLDEKEPNIVHKVLAQMEIQGIVKAILTQNIDLLHQKAGSKHILELHGSPSIHKCLKCGQYMSFDEVVHQIDTNVVPHCSKCNGVVKPDIVFFGEPLPEDTLQEAEVEAENADLMLVLGSSLTVYPAANLPILTLQHGGNIAIVNADPTPLDRYAIWKSTDLQETFDILNQEYINNMIK